MKHYNFSKIGKRKPKKAREISCLKSCGLILTLVLCFCYLVRFKLQRFPGSVMKACIMNQDVVENPFSQLRGANGQNKNRTYLLATATHNSVIFGQSTISKKCNTGCTTTHSYTELPKGRLFSRKR